MKDIQLHTTHIKRFVKAADLKTVMAPARMIHRVIERRECPGSDFLGWLHLPSSLPEALIKDIERTATQVRQDADCVLVLGIGGSYLGSRAAIEFLKPAFANECKDEFPKIYFAGHNLSADYVAELLALIKGRRVAVNVISKSGTTTETAVVFRIIKQWMEKAYGREKARERIICTTDAHQGALRRLADEEGYKSFVIPDDVGGRFSVLTPVGLVPIALAGIDIRQLVKGAADFEKKCSEPDPRRNMAYRYAAVRHILGAKGKDIEIMSTMHPSLRYLSEWWKQLFGESEGKKHKGIFPAACDFTTDLHSLGQLIQDGKRNIFETFLVVEKERARMTVPRLTGNCDGLDFLIGKDLSFINRMAYEGTASAHHDGGVPTMTISIPERTAYHLGQLFYFFEKAVAMSGLLLGVNPFNQPGVEAYKKKMFKLLGKPGA